MSALWESCAIVVNPKVASWIKAMNPNKGRVLISLALLVSGIVGVSVALSQSPRRIALFQAPAAKTEPVSTVKPIQKAPQLSRSQELEAQFEQSNAAQILKQLTKGADAKVEESKGAIGEFIQQKTNEQRDHLKQIVVEALREAVTGEVTQQTNALSDEFKGIKLTNEQSAQVQAARREMQSELVQKLQNNPTLLQQLQSDLQAGQVDKTLSQPLQSYRDRVEQLLTPQQQQKWQKNFDLVKLLSQ